MKIIFKTKEEDNTHHAHREQLNSRTDTFADALARRLHRALPGPFQCFYFFFYFY